MSAPRFNARGVWSIYRFEMARSLRTLWQSLATPVITTSLYFIVFGGAIGSRMQQVGGVDYGSFIVPDGPGFGLEIDEDKLRHYTTQAWVCDENSRVLD